MASGFNLSSGSLRITGSTSRRLRIFAVTQIAASFVLLTGAGALLKTLLVLQAAQTGFDTRHVLAINVPVISYGRSTAQVTDFYHEVIRRVRELPGVEGVAVGSSVPWRDAGNFGPGFEFSADGHIHAAGKRIRGLGSGPSRRAFLRRWAFRFLRDVISTSRIARERAGCDREPELGAANVSQSRCGQPPHDVDGSDHEVHRRKPETPAHYRRRGGC